MPARSCFCGCEHFRFKMNIDLFKDEDPQTLWYNICRNCNHSLGDHINIVRSKQAE